MRGLDFSTVNLQKGKSPTGRCDCNFDAPSGYFTAEAGGLLSVPNNFKSRAETLLGAVFRHLSTSLDTSVLLKTALRVLMSWEFSFRC